MEVEVLATFTLDDKVFGPLSQDRTRLDLIQCLSRMIHKSEGVLGVIIREFKIIDKHPDRF